MQTYELEKSIWSEKDFSIMGWHDSKIWAFLADAENFTFMVDLDYIFQWVPPNEGEGYFKFWVAPVTMVFENAFDIVLDIKSTQGEFNVADLHMENEKKAKNDCFSDYDFRFECQEGDFKLSATGFKMYVRKAPTLQSRQSLDFTSRGGVGFGREFVGS